MQPLNSKIYAGPAPGAAASRAVPDRWSIFILATAAFVIVTTEYLIVGLLPALARDLHISIALAGQLVTLFAFTVMLFGPVLTVFTSHMDRKRLFITIMLIFAVANALAAWAPNLWVLAFARFVPALALPVFWGTASDTAAQIAGPAKSGRAVSQVYLGISAALLFGVPLGTVASGTIGWRGAFWGLTALSLVMALLLTIFMPTLERPERMRVAEQLRIFHDRRFVANVVLSVLVFTAMFTAYTYLADTLGRIAHVRAPNVGWWLMGFGAVGLIGNWIGGLLVSKRPLGATVLFTVLLALGMTLTVPLASSTGLLVLALAVWGISYTALFPICQVRVMQAATHAQALAGTLNVSAANAGVGLGAIIGGLSINHLGLSSVGYIASATAALALVVAWVTSRL